MGIQSFRRALCAGVYTTLLAGTAFAQENVTREAAQGPAATERASYFDDAIVVTARRREESLLDVPVSISAFSQNSLDRIGASEVDDIAKLTPGVRFERESFGAGNRTQIAIRGISSSVGAGTVGVYLDDTPIQVRNIYYSSSNAYPKLFDLERVEILRGPQGTLFGAGSQGGTVRFIAPAADLNDVKVYSRAELAFTEHGDPSYEAGLAVSVPIVDDKFAIRASAWHRHDGGWIDRVDLYDTSKVLGEDDNYGKTTVARISATIAPTENLTITPSFFFQDQRINNGSSYWMSLSDPKKGIYRAANSIRSNGRDRFGIGAVALNWDLGEVSVVTNTSLFKRNSDFFPDYTGTGLATLTGSAEPILPPGEATQASWLDDQKNFTQEIRLQSNGDGPISWVVGAFYSHAKQRGQQFIAGPRLEELISFLYEMPLTVEEVFGEPLYQGLYSYVTDDHTVDKQLAGFGQVDWEIAERLTLTVGMRVSQTKFSFVSETKGPYLGTTSVSGTTSQTPITPKFGISYNTGEGGMIYASASKGFRVGGAQRPAPVTCASDLDDLGLTQIPRTFTSDSVWSYEAGAKGSVLDRRLQFEGSVFRVDWKDIQQSVPLSSCNLSYIDNLGSARSQGFDLALTARPTSALTLGAAIGYTNAKYREDVAVVPPLYIVRDGDTLGQRPWTVYLNGQYDLDIGGTETYFRTDYSYASHNSEPRAVDRVGYDPLVPRAPATHQVSVRAGAQFGKVDASLFVENLLNSKKTVELYRDVVTSPVFYGGSFRPRTIGMTLTYRQ
jgi:iron complex outermembrane receptor protein